MIVEGEAYTSGDSFRARAEAQQRRYRANVLQLGHGEHAHWLLKEDAERGMNFYGRAHCEVLARAADRKGVDKDRTLGNMLSSQAMCFNIFGNLRIVEGLAIAGKALRKFVPTIREVNEVNIEYTPSKDVFGDQSGHGGVDCDVLVEYATETGKGLLAIETKFVEKEFSTCGFRRRVGAADGRLASCPNDTCQGEDSSGCLYSSKKTYRYWERSHELRTLRPDILRGDKPCPFGDGLWQLWVNHTLVHAEARKRQLQEAHFAVCAPKDNDALLQGGLSIAAFRDLLTNPRSMMLLPLEDLVEALAQSVSQAPFWRKWIDYLRQRYLVR